MASCYIVAVLKAPLQPVLVPAAPSAFLQPVCSRSRNLQLLENYYKAYADETSPCSGALYLAEGGHEEDALYRCVRTLFTNSPCIFKSCGLKTCCARLSEHYTRNMAPLLLGRRWATSNSIETLLQPATFDGGVRGLAATTDLPAGSESIRGPQAVLISHETAKGSDLVRSCP